MIDYTLLMFLGLVAACVVAFRIFMPDVFGPAAKRDQGKYRRVMAGAGFLGAIVFAVMAMETGEPGSWVVAATMLAWGSLYLPASSASTR